MLSTNMKTPADYVHDAQVRLQAICKELNKQGLQVSTHLDVTDHVGLHMQFTYVGPKPEPYPEDWDPSEWESSDCEWYES
jgi:hypothetical protein